MSIANAAGLMLVLTLAACSSQDPEPNLAANRDAVTNAADQPLLPINDVTEVTAPATDAPADAAAAATIPAALHGRWGLVPGDCTSTRGDAKGLVTVSADQIRFYESVASPGKIIERTDSRIRGDFDFTGEGMEWTNHIIWSAAGDKLTRVDSEEDSRLVYMRC